MVNNTQKKHLIDQRWEMYYKLPQDAREALFSNISSEIIYNTAKSEGLLPKVSLLAEITGDVMLGILPITQFRNAIQKKLGIEEEKARRIAQTIRDKIFMKVASSLRKIHKLE